MTIDHTTTVYQLFETLSFIITGNVNILAPGCGRPDEGCNTVAVSINNGTTGDTFRYECLPGFTTRLDVLDEDLITECLDNGIWSLDSNPPSCIAINGTKLLISAQSSNAFSVMYSTTSALVLCLCTTGLLVLH